MTYVETVPEDEATGPVAEMYDTDRGVFGYLPNFARAFSARPGVYAAWRALNGAVKANMDPRRYELATLAAARELRSSYCALAHGSVLLDRDLASPEDVIAVATGGPAPALDETDRAVAEVAAKVARDATGVTADDVERLRGLGLKDDEIVDVVLAAAVRCFFSKTLDALGAEPDARYAALAPDVRDALTVGRPIAAS